MKHRNDKNELFLVSVEQAMWENFHGPTPDLELELLHGQGMLRDKGSGLLDFGLKPASQPWIYLSVMSLLAANIVTRRRQELDWLQ